MTDPRLFKIFLSSPGDVPGERDDAQAVIDEINDSGEFAHHFILKLYRWDDKAVVLPMPVTDIPQRSVDIYMLRPSECDLVVVLFWSRMGSPLVMDEREYLSGTHYEYSEALQGYRQVGKPTVWLYRCAEELLISLKDPKHDEKKRQFDLVEQFFKQFQDAEGRYTGGVNEYPTHADFKPLFKGQLLTYLRHLRDNPRPITAPGTGRSADPNLIPYRGLNALDEGDAAIFFGRDAEILEVLSRVEKQRLVFVLGASGSGKSSLAAAGVLPKLRQRGWQIVRCVPGNDPFFNLALALLPPPADMGAKLNEYLNKVRELADALRADPKSIAARLESRAAGSRVLLFIDQFEEIFTLATPNAELPPGSVPAFIRAIRQPSAQVVTLLTMRADFYGAALPHFDELKEHAYGLQRPSAFALYEMIVRPAELAGLRLDDGLAAQIVDDAGDTSGALALVAYVLEALYLRAQARGDRRLTRHDYEVELNGVRGAINTLAEDAYAKLPFDETIRQAALQAVFRELITLTEEDGNLIPTRRRAPLAAFGADSNEARLIETFAKARLLTTDAVGTTLASPAAKTDKASLVPTQGGQVEVSHEAILLHWRRLADWISAVKGDLAVFRQYERDARVWDERGRDTPQPTHEALVYFERALANLGYTRERLPEPLKSYTEPEANRLLHELKRLSDDAEVEMRRLEIGDRLSVIGDPRAGVGVKDGVPDMVWLPVEGSGGRVRFEFGEFEVKPFFIAQYQVTYAQYQAFVRAEDGFYAKNAPWWDGMPDEYKRQNLAQQRTKNASNPRDSISWYQAVAFARWLDAKYRDMGLFEQFEALTPNPSPQGEGLEGAHTPSTQPGEGLEGAHTPSTQPGEGLEGAHTPSTQPGEGLEDYRRLTNDDVFNQLEGVLIDIQRAASAPLSLGRGAGGEGWQIRLPTEWEWQWAAQAGAEEREYPWGDWRPGHANTLESGLGRATAVGMYPHGAAACGALDMAGSLWEWCLNKYDKPEECEVDASGDLRVLRGGSFNYYQYDARAVDRDNNDPLSRNFSYGVRLVCVPLSRL